MGATHCSYCVHHAPTVAMELRQRMQVHIAIVYSHVPTKGCGVQPNVAMSKLNTLWPRSRPAGVIDCRGCIFIWRPRPRLC